jgi:hypothetical protein
MLEDKLSEDVLRGRFKAGDTIKVEITDTGEELEIGLKETQVTAIIGKEQD